MDNDLKNKLELKEKELHGLKRRIDRLRDSMNDLHEEQGWLMAAVQAMGIRVDDCDYGLGNSDYLWRFESIQNLIARVKQIPESLKESQSKLNALLAREAGLVAEIASLDQLAKADTNATTKA